MRCNNCGWDNPDENVKCEKCKSAPLNDDAVMNDITPAYESASPDGFNLAKTAQGCPNPQCGYPLRPTDTECPNCGLPIEEAKAQALLKTVPEKKEQSSDEHAPNEKVPTSVKFGGTIIQGTTLKAGDDEIRRKKLVGFLVSYSHVIDGVFYPLYEGKNTIGRMSSFNIQIMNDAMVSEKHLSILYRVSDRKFKYKDELSTNGTFVNGMLMDEGELHNLDEIVIGTTRLMFIEIPQSIWQ